MNIKRKGWYERPYIQKINLDWIKTNCRVTDREMEILKIIKDRKLVRRDHLEVISPSYRITGENRTKILNKSIGKLFRKHCIDKIHEERELGKGGNNPCVVALDRGGSLLLGIAHKRRIIHHNSGEYLKRSLPSNYRHINGVNQLEVDTILFCEDANSEILAWHHEKPQELYYGQEKVIVIPDVGMTLKLNTEPPRHLYAFIEFDTSSENRGYKEPPILRDKIIKYKKYKLSKLWEKEYPRFPLLVFVCEDEDRIKFWSKKCKENGLASVGVYHTRFREFLERIAKI